MASSNESKVRLKLLIDLKTQKVLFAEAGKDFVDFLFHLLTLPIGTVTALLSRRNMVGSLGNLYDCVENLPDTYMQPNHNKDSLLKPQLPLCPANRQLPFLLLPNTSASSSAARVFYRCTGLRYSNCYACVADDPTSKCPHCESPMSTKSTYVAPTKSGGGEGGYVKGVVTYMVMDDLVVKPMSTISSITLLNHFNIKDLGSLQEKLVDLGIKEGMELLRASLKSKTVLTDVFIPHRSNSSRDNCIFPQHLKP